MDVSKGEGGADRGLGVMEGPVIGEGRATEKTKALIHDDDDEKESDGDQNRQMKPKVSTTDAGKALTLHAPNISMMKRVPSCST